MSVLSGVYYSGSNAAAAKAMGVWRGRALDLTTTFMPFASWTDIEGTNWINGYGKPGLTAAPLMCITVPMLVTGTTIAQGATGGYTAHYVTLGQRLVAAGLGSSIIRLGHEMNGSWELWSAQGKAANWITYWRSIVTAMRAVTGAHFTFCWCVSNGLPQGGGSPEDAWPGAAYVDSIGVDIYDNSWGNPGESLSTRWNRLTAGTANGTSSGTARGLNYWRDFSIAQSIPLAFPEWGICNTASNSGGGGGDNGGFIDLLLDFAAAHASLFETYFNSNPTDGHHMLGSYSSSTGKFTTGGEFPLAAAEYIVKSTNVDPEPPPPPITPPLTQSLTTAGLQPIYA